MSKPPSKDKLLSDGLRYKAKVPGSPFSGSANIGTATMSCFFCGKHRPRDQMKSRRLIGKSQNVCAPSCKERDAL